MNTPTPIKAWSKKYERLLLLDQLDDRELDWHAVHNPDPRVRKAADQIGLARDERAWTWGRSA
jgi:hypothetical protein